MTTIVPDINYSITPKHPAAHIFEVTMRIAKPDPTGQRVMLPTWIPGSYLIREFARQIVSICASVNDMPLTMLKIDKCTWQCAPTPEPITLTYEVYAWDLSVRGAHLDDTHGFFNGASVFLLAEGFRDEGSTIEIHRPAGERYASWQLATSLEKVSNGRTSSGKKLPNTSPMLEFGIFQTGSYDDLIDHPVEMGNFTHATFDAHGVPHHIVITGKHRADMPRFARDLKAICEKQISLFEPHTHTAPFDQYWFLLTVVNDGYGGLEHRASTALIANRDDLPLANETKVTPGYRKLLGLASHEYFHAWNVKRIMPAAFAPYDLQRENYTRQLWFFEGFTDYYDDLILVRSGIITPLEYLEVEAESIGRMMSLGGRKRQSVAESSFDTWIKYYRQDENSPNAIVSYYQKGALVALALDLMIRQLSQGEKSLDDVMRAMWNQYGKKQIGVPEGMIENVIEDIVGASAAPALRAFFAIALHGTDDIDLAPLFASIGIALSWRIAGGAANTANAANANGKGGNTGGKNDSAPATLGAKIVSDSNGDAKLAQVFDGGAAQAAGLSAGDTIVAVEGLRVNASNLERRIKTYSAGSSLQMIAFRRDELMHVTVTLQALAAQVCVLTLTDINAEAKRQRDHWLGA